MGALVATDASSSAPLAWYGAGLAVLLLAAGLLAASSTPVQCSVALLGTLLLLRHDERLMLAPLYGACLLLVSELAQRSLELHGPQRIGPDVVGSRLAAVLVLAAIGACAAAAAAIAVTIAPARSVQLTALGTIAVVGAFAAIVLLARRVHRATVGTRDEAGGTPSRRS